MKYAISDNKQDIIDNYRLPNDDITIETMWNNDEYDEIKLTKTRDGIFFYPGWPEIQFV